MLVWSKAGFPAPWPLRLPHHPPDYLLGTSWMSASGSSNSSYPNPRLLPFPKPSHPFVFSSLANWASQVARGVMNHPAGDVRGMDSIPGLRRPEDGMATRSSILAWRIPMDREAWWVIVHGVTKCWTILKQLSAHAYALVNYQLPTPKILLPS